MDKNKILTMEEGKEIDDLVAEKVMGWHIEKQDKYRDHWVDSENKYQCGVAGKDEIPDCEDLHCLNWYPSSSIVWAWDVVEKMHKDGYGYDMDIHNHKPRCRFGVGHEIAEADEMPLAICRAALLAVME